MKLLFIAYFKIQPFLYALVIICIAAIVANQYINRRSKPVNNPYFSRDLDEEKRN